MKTRKLIPLVAVLIIAILACNLPATSIAGPDLVGTYAAQTVAVEQTLASLGLNTPIVPPVATTQVAIPPTAQATLTWTLSPTRTLTPVPCNKAKYVKDLTIEDDTVLAANTAFTKKWRIQNDGTCTWTTAYSVYFYSGTQMGAPASIPLTTNVYPGDTYDISIPMTAPATAGTYTSNWKMKDQNGTNFITNPLYVRIIVAAFTNTIVYNFADHYCDAEWRSAAGILHCPGVADDAEGFVIRKDNPKWSSGTQEDEHAIFTHPQWTSDGFIQGMFPARSVQSGDRFVADIGCLTGGTACNFKYQVAYRVDDGALQTLVEGNKTYADGPSRLNVDLSSLAGHSIKFALLIFTNGSATQDWAIWLMPSIRR